MQASSAIGHVGRHVGWTLKLAARSLAFLVMVVIVFACFGNLLGYFQKFSAAGITVTSSIWSLVATGVVLGAILFAPARLVFGQRLGPMLLALSGIPVAMMSFPPSPEAVAANGGVVGYIGAVCCTLVPGIVAWALQRMTFKH